MKANELSYKDLMIGDWVKPKNVDVNFRVGLIGVNSIWNDTDTHEWDYDELEPIPLTAGILEKNGFVYDSKDKLFEDIYPRISMLYAQYRLVENGCINYGEMSEIKYVHELQHALKLCKIEKEIEL